jgi:hypothetical protein
VRKDYCAFLLVLDKAEQASHIVTCALENRELGQLDAYRIIAKVFEEFSYG